MFDDRRHIGKLFKLKDIYRRIYGGIPDGILLLIDIRIPKTWLPNAEKLVFLHDNKKYEVQEGNLYMFEEVIIPLDREE